MHRKISNEKTEKHTEELRLNVATMCEESNVEEMNRESNNQVTESNCLGST